MDEIKKLVHQFEQNELAEPLVQKMNIIAGDITMNRNHDENLRYLRSLMIELEKRIESDLVNGKKTEGFEKMRDEVFEWIQIIIKIKTGATS